MAEGVLFGIAEGIVANLASIALKQIRPPFGVKYELCKLERTITAIKAVLLDAEEKKAINNQVKVWLDSLEDVLYDADNLVDEFRYQHLRCKVLFGKKKARKVRVFFSSSNQLVFRLKMAKKVKQIRKTLDEIKGSRQFHLDERLEETRVVSPMSSRETHSFVIDSEVIGREKDKKELLGLLLYNNVDTKKNVSVISLVGLGGLGKTTLAQVVFNDESVKKHFNNNTYWVCTSDSFDLRSLLEKIIRSATETGPDPNLNLQQLQNKVREQIKDKRYLLVLDDVWNEDEGKWEALETFLKLGAKGSRVLITTRSINVAHTVHSIKTHMLNGLDKDKSWALFERVAFEDRNYEPSEYPRLVEIGKDIVAKCKGVPLAIKTLGRLLTSKRNSLQNLEINEWISFRDIELANIDYTSESDILPTLKLSYNHLPSHLKHCFAYCSLFPKDHRIDVQQLIQLWIAQGFVKPTRNKSQLEEIGYEYFMILFWGCFFQEAKINELSRTIETCKMHDLMHDLASLVAGKSIEILDISGDRFERSSNSTMLDRDTENSIKKVRHVYIDFKSDSSFQIPMSLFEQKKVRSFILCESKSFSSSNFDSVVSNYKFLRALSLKSLEALPNSFHKVNHLRYLNLSETVIKELPNSITMLYNLQTLILFSCYKLECLPPNIQNLINLRHLKIDRCLVLTHMPCGIGGLTSLQTLDAFVVADNKSSESAGFVELSKLKNLRGHLEIKIRGLGNKVKSESGAAKYLKDKDHLVSLSFVWVLWDTDEETMDNIAAKEVFECLEPPHNIKAIQVRQYPGVTFPNWLSMLNNLVRLELSFCLVCKYLPSLHHLSSLKEISLYRLSALEYVSEWHNDWNRGDHPSTSSMSSTTSFFPSLTKLQIEICHNLQGWWGREIRDFDEAVEPFFPKLSELKINNCPRLTAMPLFPNLEKLDLGHSSLKPLEGTMKMKLKSDSSVAATSSAALSKLKDLIILEVDDLESLPEEIHNLSSLQHLEISDCNNLTSLPEGISNLKSLQNLEIYRCNNLTSLPVGISYLKSLENLRISDCNNLTSLPEGISNLKSLQNLEISVCNNLTSLPVGISNLKSLQNLRISDCNNLTSLPEGISNLKSLQNLEIYCCNNLTSLPVGISNLKSLKNLRISDCNNLTSLPEGISNLKSLQNLEISDCNNLTSLPVGISNQSQISSET